MATEYYGTLMTGNTVWVGSSSFTTYAQFKAVDEGNPTGYRMFCRAYMSTSGNFYGTNMRCSWGGNGTVNSPGTYFDSGWCDWGIKTFGTSVSFSGYVDYTSNSGQYYNSSVGVTYIVPDPSTSVYVYDSSGSWKHGKSLYVFNGSSWKKATAVHVFNGSSWKRQK